jgi:hypothetical protein
MRAGDRFAARHFLGLSADRWDSLSHDGQQTLLTVWRADGRDKGAVIA